MSDAPAVTYRLALALGSNVGDRHAYLRSALAAVQGLECVRVLGATEPEETEAVGPAQPPFVNQMVLLDTDCSLASLLTLLHAIEEQHGRMRSERKGPRTLDLDIVWVRDVTITSRELLVPHPGLVERDFWQRELAALLGVDAAREAIAAAEVHAGLDTSDGTAARHERRLPGT